MKEGIEKGDIIYVQIMGATWGKAEYIYAKNGFLRFKTLVEGENYGNIVESTERYIITKLEKFNNKDEEGHKDQID